MNKPWLFFIHGFPWIIATFAGSIKVENDGFPTTDKIILPHPIKAIFGSYAALHHPKQN